MLKLYWSPDSANLVIRIALELLELPYQAVRVNRGTGDHKLPKYLEKNPQGLLPLLEDGPLVLFETGAILWHVIERAGRFGPNGPEATDPVARAAAMKWMFYLSNTLHADLRCEFYSNRYVPDQMVHTFREGLRARMAQHCDLLEREISGGGLLGSGISVPDVYLCVCLRWAQIYPSSAQPMLDGLERWPVIVALSARIQADPAAVRAFEAEFIDPNGALTASAVSMLSSAEVTGTI